jgi:hypothetical protein
MPLVLLAARLVDRRLLSSARTIPALNPRTELELHP